MLGQNIWFGCRAFALNHLQVPDPMCNPVWWSTFYLLFWVAKGFTFQIYSSQEMESSHFLQTLVVLLDRPSVSDFVDSAVRSHVDFKLGKLHDDSKLCCLCCLMLLNNHWIAGRNLAMLHGGTQSLYAPQIMLLLEYSNFLQPPFYFLTDLLYL